MVRKSVSWFEVMWYGLQERVMVHSHALWFAAMCYDSQQCVALDVLTFTCRIRATCMIASAVLGRASTILIPSSVSLPFHPSLHLSLSLSPSLSLSLSPSPSIPPSVRPSLPHYSSLFSCLLLPPPLLIPTPIVRNDAAGSALGLLGGRAIL